MKILLLTSLLVAAILFLLGCSGAQSPQVTPPVSFALHVEPGSKGWEVPGGIFNYGDVDSTLYAQIQILNDGAGALRDIRLETDSVKVDSKDISTSLSPSTLPGLLPRETRTFIITLPKGEAPNGPYTFGARVTAIDVATGEVIQKALTIRFNIVRE